VCQSVVDGGEKLKYSPLVSDKFSVPARDCGSEIAPDQLSARCPPSRGFWSKLHAVTKGISQSCAEYQRAMSHIYRVCNAESSNEGWIDRIVLLR
jgi:hypothetical protein